MYKFQFHRSYDFMSEPVFSYKIVGPDNNTLKYKSDISLSELLDGIKDVFKLALPVIDTVPQTYVMKEGNKLYGNVEIIDLSKIKSFIELTRKIQSIYKTYKFFKNIIVFELDEPVKYHISDGMISKGHYPQIELE